MKRSVLLLLLMVVTVLMCLSAAPAHATRILVDERGLMPDSDRFSVALTSQDIRRPLVPSIDTDGLWQASHLNDTAPLPDHWQLADTPAGQRPALSAWVSPSEPAPTIVRTLDPTTLRHQPDPMLAPFTLLLLAFGVAGLTLLRQQQSV